MIVKDLMNVMVTDLPINVTRYAVEQMKMLGENLTRLDCMVRFGDKFVIGLLLTDKEVEITIK